MDKFQIRSATSDKAAAISCLHRQAWQEGFAHNHVYPDNGEQRWHDELTASRLTVLLAHENGIPIAYLAFRNAEQEIEITDLFVKETQRRKGIASDLLESLFAQDTGVYRYSLWVAESNSAAKSLYGRFGFVPTDESKTEVRRRDCSHMVRWSRSFASTK